MPINDVQTTNRQHAVPQNIMDVEFKIIGDLTMRQFFYLLIFGIIAYACFALMTSIIKWPLVLFFALTGLALAFLPIEERGLDQWIINFFRSIYSDNQKVWRKEPQLIAAFSYQNLNVVRNELITLTPTSSRRKLEEFLDLQEGEKAIDPLDIQESVYIKKVRDTFDSIPTPQPQVTSTQTTTVVTAPEKVEEPQITPQPKDNQLQEVKETPVRVEEQPIKEVSEVPKIELPKRDYVPLEPITPDRHSGRRFINLLPQEGEIILPIRGEKTIETSEEIQIEQEIEEKAQQLKKLLEQIKVEEGLNIELSVKEEGEEGEKKETDVQTPQPEQTPAPAQQTVIIEKEAKPSPEIEKTLQHLREENERLTQQIKMLRAEIDKTESNAEKTQKIQTLQQLEQEKDKTSKNYFTIKQGFSELKEKVFVKEAIGADVDTPDKIESTKQPAITPNIVKGSVKDQAGKGIPGIVLIIKNTNGEPVRALKTNQLGGFSISTPLSNGEYTIETDKAKKTNLAFDIMKVVTDGTVMPSLEIQGKP